MAITIVGSGPNNNPNSAANMPIEVQTSFIPELYTSLGNIRGGQNAGYGSFMKRDVAAEVATYYPYRFAADTLIQKIAKFRTTDKPMVEWGEKDALPPLETTVSGNITASAAATLAITVPAGHTTRFRKGDKVRYANAAGNYVIVQVVDINAGTNTLTVSRPGGADFANTSAWNINIGAVIQVLGKAVNHELNITPEPRLNVPTMEYTYVEDIAHEIEWADRAASEDAYIKLYTDAQDDLYEIFRFNRSVNVYYGVREAREITLPDGKKDWIYFSPGLWDLIYGNSRIESSFVDGSGNLNAANFKQTIYRAFERYWGAESGGPYMRPVIHDAKFGSFLGQAFEDKQQFYGTEFIGGIQVSRYEHNGSGIADFLPDPMLEFRHPLVNGSLKQGAGRAVAMILPIAECVTRVQYTNGGPGMMEWKNTPADRVSFMRVETVEGLQLQNIQYTGAIVEVAP